MKRSWNFKQMSKVLFFVFLSMLFIAMICFFASESKKKTEQLKIQMNVNFVQNDTNEIVQNEIDQNDTVRFADPNIKYVISDPNFYISHWHYLEPKISYFAFELGDDCYEIGKEEIESMSPLQVSIFIDLVIFFTLHRDLEEEFSRSILEKLLPSYFPRMEDNEDAI